RSESAAVDRLSRGPARRRCQSSRQQGTRCRGRFDRFRRQHVRRARARDRSFSPRLQPGLSRPSLSIRNCTHAHRVSRRECRVIHGSAVVCNCFGHDQAIAEYVMAALLARHVPLADADQKLRQGDWAYSSGSLARLHDELAEKTIGLLGYGHIGKAIAMRAKAFEMKVHVANRSAVATSSIVDRSFTLDNLRDFWASADFFVVSVPLTAETTGIVDAAAFAGMRATAVVL